MKIIINLGKVLLIIALTMLLAGVPYIIFVLLSDCEIVEQMFSKNSTDVLGYYGALIGSVVTILGVYWTINYESKKSKEDRKNERKKEEEDRKRELKLLKEERENERQKEEVKRTQERELLKEERRKNSLPILRFSYDPDYKTPPFVVTEENTIITSQYHNILLNTTRKCSIEKGKREHLKSSKTDVKTSAPIFEYGWLEIENIGLGAAILSDAHLYRSDKEEIVNNLQVDTINNYIIPPNKMIGTKMCICSHDFSEDDYLCVDFIDIYSNKYRYEISFEKNFPHADCKTKIHSEMVSVLPKLIEE